MKKSATSGQNEKKVHENDSYNFSGLKNKGKN